MTCLTEADVGRQRKATARELMGGGRGEERVGSYGLCDGVDELLNDGGRRDSWKLAFSLPTRRPENETRRRSHVDCLRPLNQRENGPLFYHF